MRSFKRGVHPNGNKILSMNEPIRDILPGKELVFPIAQHIGAPATPIVKIGDRVLVGQIIAEATSFVSANIISSVSGTVTNIGPRTTIMGETMDSIIIENDEKYETVADYGKEQDYMYMNNEEIVQAVRNAGIVGLGGAGFPTSVKLSPKDPEAIEYIIVNGAECEPYLTSDYRLMLEKTDELINGLKIILYMFKNAKGYIGIENNKPEAIQVLTEALKDEENIEVVPLKTKYPQGGERMLIHAISGRDICSSQLPMDAGCIVENVASVIAINDAVCFNKPLTQRIMTVTGDAVNTPCNLRVYIGDSYQHVLDEAGGFKEQPQKMISGGPMMGISMFTLDIPVVKTSASILALLKDDVAMNPTTACIHCGRCVKACPENLIPQMMHTSAEATNFEQFEKLHGMECIECGSCSYVCPAKIPLTQSFQYAKRMVAAKRRAEKAKQDAKKEKEESK